MHALKKLYIILVGAHFISYQVWSRIEAVGGTPPPVRDSHSALLCNDTMIIYGGSSGEALGDMSSFNFHTKQWTPLNYEPKCNFEMNGDSGFCFEAVADPGKRFCHSAVLHGNCMVVYGGKYSVYVVCVRINSRRHLRRV